MDANQAGRIHERAGTVGLKETKKGRIGRRRDRSLPRKDDGTRTKEAPAEPAKARSREGRGYDPPGGCSKMKATNHGHSSLHTPPYMVQVRGQTTSGQIVDGELVMSRSRRRKRRRQLEQVRWSGGEKD